MPDTGDYYTHDNERRRINRLRGVRDMARDGSLKVILDAARVSETDRVMLSAELFRDIVELLECHTKVDGR